MKLTGAQLKAFWAAPLDENMWFEDETLTVDGAEFDTCNDIDTIPDSAACVLSGGFVANDPKQRSVEGLARSWLKAQTTTILVVEVDNDIEAAVRAMLKTYRGVKVTN